jgi:hypothetical protein
VIAFAGIRSRIATEGAIFSEGRVAGASATLTRAQGGASAAEFTRPMSHRRGNTQQRHSRRREELARMRIVTSSAATLSISACGVNPAAVRRWPVTRSRSSGAAGLAKVLAVLLWSSRLHHMPNWSMLMVC